MIKENKYTGGFRPKFGQVQELNLMEVKKPLPILLENI